MKNKLPSIQLPKSCNISKLARKSKVPQSTLSMILSGQRRANPIHAKQLAAVSPALGISMTLMDWLYPEDSESVCILINRG
jgi:transcriptional regulator with XRE-family HTH domain